MTEAMPPTTDREFFSGREARMEQGLRETIFSATGTALPACDAGSTQRMVRTVGEM